MEEIEYILENNMNTIGNCEKAFKILKAYLHKAKYHHPVTCDSDNKGCNKCSILMQDNFHVLPVEVRNYIRFTALILDGIDGEKKKEIA